MCCQGRRCLTNPFRYPVVIQPRGSFRVDTSLTEGDVEAVCNYLREHPSCTQVVIQSASVGPLSSL